MKKNKIKSKAFNKVSILIILSLLAFKVHNTIAQIPCKMQIKNNFRNEAMGNTIIICSDSVKIHYPFYLDDLSVNSETLIFSKKLSEIETAFFCKHLNILDIFSLKDEYLLYGAADGNNIYFDIEINNQKKQIHVFEYYHPQVDKLIKLVNKIIPKKYHIGYNKINLRKRMKMAGVK